MINARPADIVIKEITVEEFLAYKPTNTVKPHLAKKLAQAIPDCLDAVKSGNPIRVRNDLLEAGCHRQLAARIRVSEGTLDPQFRFSCIMVVRPCAQAESAIAGYRNNNCNNSANALEQLFTGVNMHSVPIVKKMLLPALQAISNCPQYINAPRTDPKALACRLAALFYKDSDSRGHGKIYQAAKIGARYPGVTALDLRRLSNHPVCLNKQVIDQTPTVDLNPIVNQLAIRIYPALSLIADLRTPANGQASEWEKIFNRSDTFELFLLDFALRGILQKIGPTNMKKTITGKAVRKKLPHILESFKGKDADTAYFAMLKALKIPKEYWNQ